MTNSSFSSCSKPLRAARSGKPPLSVPPHPTCSPTGLGNPLGQPTVVLCSQPRDRPSWPTAGAQEMFWLNEWLLPERLLVLLWVPGTRQRVEYPCLVGTSASVSPNNQCQGRKGPRAHLVHLTDAQRGYSLAPITQPAGGRAGTQAQHSHCPGNISSGELMVLQFTSSSPAFCVPATSHTLPPQRANPIRTLLIAPESRERWPEVGRLGSGPDPHKLCDPRQVPAPR